MPDPLSVRKKVLFAATVYRHLAAFHIPFMTLELGLRGPRRGRAGGGGKDEIEALGVRCHDVPFARSFTSTRNWRAYRKLRRLPAMERYDLIYVHTPVAAWLTWLAARGAGHCPVLYTTHGLHFFHGAPRAY